MRYFKRIKDNSYKNLEVGNIYPEDFYMPCKFAPKTVKQSVNSHGFNWKEVSEIDYIKQQGWYIRGSKEFMYWLDRNSHIDNRENWSGISEANFYYVDDENILRAKARCRGTPENKVNVTIDQLNEIYNIKPKEKEMEFKVGDEVLVTSWHYDTIDLPQKGVINKIKTGSCTPYGIEIEKDQYGDKSTWWFKEGEFEHLNKQIKQMENFKVEVNPTTSKILQELAFENGWSWRAGNTKPKWYHSDILAFEPRSKDVSIGHLSGAKKISLEEAINRLTTKEESFKEGDYAVVIQSGHSQEGNVVRIVSPYIQYNIYPIQTKKISGNHGDIFKKSHLRKATDEEIRSALIKEAKRRGYDKGVYINNSNLGYSVNNRIKNNIFIYNRTRDTLTIGAYFIYKEGKWAEIVSRLKEIFGFEVEKLDTSSNPKYKFGCSEHIYTKKELERIMKTLGELDEDIFVTDLYEELESLIYE